MTDKSLIATAILNPPATARFSPAQWDLLIRQGRRANLLARLAITLDDQGLAGHIPAAAASHLHSARRMVDRQTIAIEWEVRCICAALQSCGARIILLKGAAYAMTGLPVARGRNFSDVDILVDKSLIATVERDLLLRGWHATALDAYDQRYYRQWMHEIPPLVHSRRGTTIDVHHAILPETARIKVKTAALLEAAVPIAGCDNLFTLAPIDMVLHSATHLFHEGELGNGMRDLFDLDSLFRHFGGQPEFWNQIVPRAAELGLQRPLFYALRYTSTLLGTPIPLATIQAAASGGPNRALRSIMDFCYRRGLRPLHPSTRDAGTEIAINLLYIRSHWIRMPIHLLAYHLGRKALVRHASSETKPLTIEKGPGHQAVDPK